MSKGFRETSFEATQDPKVDDTFNSINPIALNPYEFMTDSFYGTGGYRAGNFLFPHIREIFYDSRRMFSHYRNYVQPVVKALIDPVFMEQAPRAIFDSSGAEIAELSDTKFGTFIEDCDNNKTHLQDFTEGVMCNARLHGVTFVVVDNFPDSVQPATDSEAIEDRILPYVYNNTADKVYSYQVDDFGKLREIVFQEDPVINDKGEEECRYRLWNDIYSQVMTTDSDGKLIEVEPPVEHGLDQIPVVVIISGKKRNNTEILINPPLYDLARINLSIYNKDSEVRDQERAQAFSNFYIQCDDPGNLTVGPYNVIFLDKDTTIPPGFASPNPALLSGLVENTEKLVDSLYQIAEQNGVKGVQSAKSGVAIQWDFYAQESQLKKTSKMATKLEQDIAELFRAYTGDEFFYIVDYPKDFLPGDTSAELNNIKTILDFDIPQSFRNKLISKVARMMLQDEDQKEVAQIVEDINAMEEPEEIQTIEADIEEETEDETAEGDTTTQD